MTLDSFELTKRINEGPNENCHVEFRVKSGPSSAWLLVQLPDQVVPDVTFIPEDSFKRAIFYVPRSQAEHVNARLEQ